MKIMVIISETNNAIRQQCSFWQNCIQWSHVSTNSVPHKIQNKLHDTGKWFITIESIKITSTTAVDTWHLKVKDTESD